jgi:hypothetical protein
MAFGNAPKAKDAYDAGLRGGEKPKGKPKAKKDVKRVTVEPASNGGHIVTVERHQPKPGAKGAPTSFPEPERHAHADTASAHAHVGQLMNQMSPEGDGGE